MKATGIVRRIDDLGRVVIPKEIRREMRIREGDPLEIYTNSDGSVTFKRYIPMGEKDYAKAKQILKAVLPRDVHFALYDLYGDIQEATSINQFDGEHKIDRAYIPDNCYAIQDYDVIGYLYIKGDVEDKIKQIAVKTLAAFYKED
ncbi:MAG: AbrB/MazE/SpoVT family DNA-binding domain-containing protein [Bacteroidales bacterium]|nr:AbrB/MazE/SpoVT family DNA-binding domain-containing protein [Bacteroidales bacterium]